MELTWTLLPTVLIYLAGQGNAVPSSRIIGGDEVEAHSIPYQAFLNVTGPDDTTWICGGSLITPNYVLTAGRCVYGASSVEVVLGAHDITTKEIYQLRLESQDYTVYPEYTTNVTHSLYVTDIAIVTLPKTVELSNEIQTVRLTNPYDKFDTYADKIGTISGWGLTDGYNDTSYSPVLRAQAHRIMNDRECINAFIDLSSYDLCTESNSTESPCVGDYGSPLTVDGIQVGIAVHGVEHCEPETPFVYTRISDFLFWIKEETDYVDDYTTPTTEYSDTASSFFTSPSTISIITSTIDTDSTIDTISTTPGKAYGIIYTGREYITLLIMLLTAIFVQQNFE